MDRPLDNTAREEGDWAKRPAAEGREGCADGSTDLEVVVSLAAGTGAFSEKELEVIERYMADILDEVLR